MNMKKIINVFFIVLFFSLSTRVSAYIECDTTKEKYEEVKESITRAYSKYSNATYNDPNRSNYYDEYRNLLEKWLKWEDSYNDCIEERNNQIQEASSLFDDWFDEVKRWNYEEWIQYYKKYLQINRDENDQNYKAAVWNLIIALNALASTSRQKELYDEAIGYYKESLQYDKRNYQTFWWLWITYWSLWDYNKALDNYREALKYSKNSNDIDAIKEWITGLEEAQSKNEMLKNAPSNDTFSWYQYYLKDLNIPRAWSKVKAKNEVIVAVIDDGMNINHPDLVDSLWVNKNAKYWESKIIDFVWDWLVDNLSTWDHGTMIAWIIWAKINNQEWIAWIAKNVKIMPLRVFWLDQKAEEESTIKAIEYAIENGANMINLSLWQSQFKYSDGYDEVIKKAYQKGVIVVIAAGNWDILSKWENGVNLTNNPIAPVCNNGWKYNKFSIWVMASDKNWYRTKWSNYWDCAAFLAPWEDIVSTSIPITNSFWTNYKADSGTSFSAPIITGIIALWFNEYWYFSPDIVYDTLLESLVENSAGNFYVDAEEYIINLWKKSKQKELVKKGELIFNSIYKSTLKLSEWKRNKKLNSTLITLKNFINKVKDSDKKIILNTVIERLEWVITK